MKTLLALSCALLPANVGWPPEIPFGLALPHMVNVNMDVRSRTGGYWEISEPFLWISLGGQKDGSGAWRFAGRAERDFLNFDAYPATPEKPEEGYSLLGSGVNISIQPQGDGYSLFGFIDSASLSLSLVREREKEFMVWGQGGVHLATYSFNGQRTLTGSVDLALFGKKPLAVLGAALAVIGELETRPGR
ncbi:MAG: hypothetical protein HY921_11570 [Elusimicrobia bacterium]|nr:hypothetical protein [Elusimicrobiota bacterium]